MLLFVWVILLIMIVLWKQKQEKEICHKPVSLRTPDGIQWTEPPIDTTLIRNGENGSTIVMRVGEKRKVALSGNATTGYAWRIVKMEGGSVRPDEKWHYQAQPPFLTGSGGQFLREFEAVQPGLTEVYFIYDPVSNPVRFGYYYFLRFDVRY